MEDDRGVLLRTEAVTKVVPLVYLNFFPEEQEMPPNFLVVNPISPRGVQVNI